ncbi:MAG: hypothetical protein CME04_20195 [Gemmatimonadaceae bacterium]|nr:hypothetical protein [Gemmatimonadaceae bacterium]
MINVKRTKAWLLVGAAALLLGVGCLSLTPIQAMHKVELEPGVTASGQYEVNPVDGSVSYVHEGLRLRVEHLSADMLDAQIPGVENPYVYRHVDYDQGFVPQRFTIFQLTLSNPTFDKVLAEPQRCHLVTDRGKVLRPYALTRTSATGDPRNFETYWLSRGVQSGNAQKIYLERMAVLRGAIFQPNSFVFKGNTYSGKLAFDPLPLDTEEVVLHLDRLVLEFGIYDIPKTQTDLEFRFAVDSRIVDAGVAAR